MALASLWVTAFVLLGVAAYAQIQIPRFTAGRASVMLARGVLAATGIAFGGVSAAISATDPGRAALIFLIGFGAVHFPAAFILFVKQARHSGKS